MLIVQTTDMARIVIATTTSSSVNWDWRSPLGMAVVSREEDPAEQPPTER
jgi:hypothetical protein